MKTTLLRAFVLFSAAWLCMGGAKADVTPEEPSKDDAGVYQIGSAAELSGFAALDNVATANAKLTADIDMSDAGWAPLANYSGTFDGGGHTIKNLGKTLFQQTNGDAVIKNLRLTGTLETGHFQDGSAFCYGSFVGKADGTSITMTNCINERDVTAYNTGDDVNSNNTGGLIGSLACTGISTLTGCINTGVIKPANEESGAKSAVQFGGLIGTVAKNTSYRSTLKMIKCGNKGDVSSYHTSVDNNGRAGGLIGWIGEGTSSKKRTIEISECYNTGTIKTNAKYAAAFIGSTNNYVNVTIENSWNTGSITAKSGAAAIASQKSANADLIINNCWNNGTVTGGASGYTFAPNGATCTGCYCKSGEKEDACLISSPELLMNFSDFVNIGKAYSAPAKLTADIDMSAVDNFTPIGKAVMTNADARKTCFLGKFDGQGHTIRNLTIVGDADGNTSLGLFSRVYSTNSSVKNLFMEHVNISTSQTAAVSIGSIVGHLDRFTLINCGAVDVTISHPNFTSSLTACDGGVCGYMVSHGQSNMVNCFTDYASYGVKGDDAIITNCYAKSDFDTKAATGELCYLLNGDQSNIVWYQTLGDGGDAYPVLDNTHRPVRKVDDSYVNDVDGLPCENGFYQIGTADQLVKFSNLVNDGNIGVNGKLTADINMSEVDNFTPIGLTSGNGDHNYNNYAYKGTFDGQGHTISNLTIAVDDTEAWQVGLFGRINGASVSNLGLNTVSITQTSTIPAAAGALAGRNGSSTVSNCYAINVSFYQNATSSSGGDATSGLVGYMSDADASKMINCYTDYASLAAKGNKATITNSYCDVDVATKAATGELCYLLNENSSDGIWRQTLGTDMTPKLTADGDKVYPFATSGTTPYFVNNELSPEVPAMTLTDMADYAADANFTATSLTYERTLAAGGYHSLCLPFAVTTAMLGSGSKLFTLSVVGTDAVTLTEVDEVAAGTPCFASVTTEFKFGTLTLENVAMVKDVDNSGAIKGTFTNQTIDEGFYKLSSDGTYFGLTTDGATATAFRSYIEAPTSGSVKTLNILLSDGTSLTPTLSEEQPKVIYDLAGRRVEKATKGLYIINGKKVVK